MTPEEGKQFEQDALTANQQRLDHALANIMETSSGRAVLSSILRGAHWSVPVSHEAPDLSYITGVKSVGESLYQRMFDLAPELVFEMQREEGIIQQRLDEASQIAAAAQQDGEEIDDDEEE